MTGGRSEKESVMGLPAALIASIAES